MLHRILGALTVTGALIIVIFTAIGYGLNTWYAFMGIPVYMIGFYLLLPASLAHLAHVLAKKLK